MMKYFTGSLLFTAACLGLGGYYGYVMGGMSVALTTLWICLVLGLLEVSLAFDQSVATATVPQDMAPD